MATMAYTVKWTSVLYAKMWNFIINNNEQIVNRDPLRGLDMNGLKIGAMLLLLCHVCIPLSLSIGNEMNTFSKSTFFNLQQLIHGSIIGTGTQVQCARHQQSFA